MEKLRFMFLQQNIENFAKYKQHNENKTANFDRNHNLEWQTK